jgi:hypothetical protein
MKGCGNQWTNFVSDFAKKKNISYMCAMSMPELKAEYRAKYGSSKKVSQKKERESMGQEDVKRVAHKKRVNSLAKLRDAKIAEVAKEKAENITMAIEDIDAPAPATKAKKGRPAKYATAEEARQAKIKNTIDASKRRQVAKRLAKAEAKAEKKEQEQMGKEDKKKRGRPKKGAGAEQSVDELGTAPVANYLQGDVVNPILDMISDADLQKYFGGLFDGASAVNPNQVYTFNGLRFSLTNEQYQRMRARVRAFIQRTQDAPRVMQRKRFPPDGDGEGKRGKNLFGTGRPLLGADPRTYTPTGGHWTPSMMPHLVQELNNYKGMVNHLKGMDNKPAPYKNISKHRDVNKGVKYFVGEIQRVNKIADKLVGGVRGLMNMLGDDCFVSSMSGGLLNRNQIFHIINAYGFYRDLPAGVKEQILNAIKSLLDNVDDDEDQSNLIREMGGMKKILQTTLRVMNIPVPNMQSNPFENDEEQDLELFGNEFD